MIIDNNLNFSIIIPTYNSEFYIRDTIQSVVNQTYNNYEIIISDDGSHDNTIELVNDILNQYSWIKVKILTGKHQGPGAARNKGIMNANYDWISFLDSDDEWFPNKLDEVSKYILHNENTDLVAHNILEIYEGKKFYNECHKKHDSEVDLFLSLFRQNSLMTSAVTVKLDYLKKVDLFDPSLLTAQDYDLWLKLAKLPGFNIGFIDKPLSNYLVRDDSVSNKINTWLNCRLRIGNKHYNYLKNNCNHALKEKLRYDGDVYASVGVRLLRNDNITIGIWYILKGLIIYPFRMDKLYVLKRLIIKYLKC